MFPFNCTQGDSGREQKMTCSGCPLTSDSFITVSVFRWRKVLGFLGISLAVTSVLQLPFPRRSHLPPHAKLHNTPPTLAGCSTSGQHSSLGTWEKPELTLVVIVLICLHNCLY